MISEHEFELRYRKARLKFLDTPYQLAYKAFDQLGIFELHPNDIEHQASNIVVKVRDFCWEAFRNSEDAFSSSMYATLVDDDLEDYLSLDGPNAIKLFVQRHSEKFYKLSLANTQSRRSRAGAEFEAIVELLLLASGARLDSQGALAGGLFEENGLGKAVDLVVPGVAEYSIKKNKVVLVSCKTTLRERWQEVVEEKNRTGAAEIYLATLDEKISSKTIDNLGVQNVYIVTRKELVESRYSGKGNVISFEELISDIKEKGNYWEKVIYTAEEKEAAIYSIEKQIALHRGQGRLFVEENLSKCLKSIQEG